MMSPVQLILAAEQRTTARAALSRLEAALSDVLCGSLYEGTSDELATLARQLRRAAYAADQRLADAQRAMVDEATAAHDARERLVAATYAAAMGDEPTEPEDDDDVESCPGCGCRPGDGLTPSCNDPMGCGAARAETAASAAAGLAVRAGMHAAAAPVKRFPTGRDACACCVYCGTMRVDRRSPEGDWLCSSCAVEVAR